jgi:tRNA splicing endonuclease
MRRDRPAEGGNDLNSGEQVASAEQPAAAPSFESRCRVFLEQRFGSVEDGTSFGATFHCYKEKEQQQQQQHAHGDALVLCVPFSEAKCDEGDFAFGLRYLSVASRVATTTRKRLLVAFPSDEDDGREGIRLVELVSMT